MAACSWSAHTQSRGLCGCSPPTGRNNAGDNHSLPWRSLDRGWSKRRPFCQLSATASICYQFACRGNCFGYRSSLLGILQLGPCQGDFRGRRAAPGSAHCCINELCSIPVLFLVLLPYLGNILAKLFLLWVFLAVIVGVAVTYQFGF